MHDRSVSDFGTGSGYAFGGIGSGGNTPSTPSHLKKKKRDNGKAPFPPESWNEGPDDYFGSTSSLGGGSGAGATRGDFANGNGAGIYSNGTGMKTSQSMPVSRRYDDTATNATASFGTKFEDEGRRHPHLTSKPTSTDLSGDYSPPPARARRRQCRSGRGGWEVRRGRGRRRRVGRRRRRRGRRGVVRHRYLVVYVCRPQYTLFVL